MPEIDETMDIQLDSADADELRLARMRHSASHVMAEAILEVFPDAKLAIGPAIKDGFYYDFDLPRSLTPEDLADIEQRMNRIRKGAYPFVRDEISRAEALDYFKDQPYKVEIINDLPDDSIISRYTQDTFTDLCRGPHVADTSEIGPVKLLNVAGAYWRGDEHRPMLQRIYGTAWPTQEELDAYLERMEEARQRDHRKIGKELGLFYISEEVGAGLPLFTPKGEMLRHLMEDYVRETQTRYGYQHVWTGHVVKEDLYKRSGHYDNYKDSMFPPMVAENATYRLKPMNCPSHMMLYKEMGLHSYRDLPLRLAEFATLYRYEKTGELQGLTRVRALTQDDCHIFCTPDQIQEEFGRALMLIQEILSTYGFTDYRVRLSLRGDQGKYVADDERWSLATAALKASLDAYGVDYFEAEGEAAFYGPKADFIANDVLGRDWQLSTIQVDFIQPARLGCEYVGEDGERHTPVLLHRAVTGTTERFMGILIEHFAGVFPVWLSPVQATIIPIADRHAAYAEVVRSALSGAKLRVEVDASNERMQAKIRNAQLQHVPYMLVVGDKEEQAQTVAVRLRSGENLGAMPLDDFINLAKEMNDTKSLALTR